MGSVRPESDDAPGALRSLQEPEDGPGGQQAYNPGEMDLDASDDLDGVVAALDAPAPAKVLRGPREKDRMPTSPELAEAVRAARTTQGLTRRELARRADVQYDQIKVIEGCVTRTVALSTGAAVLAVLGIDEIPEPETQPLDLWWKVPEGRVALRRIHRYLFRHRRLRCGLTQAQLARRVEASTATYQGIEYTKHKGEHDAELLARVATVLEVRPRSNLGSEMRRLGFVWCGPPRKRRIDYDAVPLGTKSDTEIAEELGVRTRDVWRERRQREIPPFQGPRRVLKKNEPPWTAEQLREELGDPPVSRDSAGRARVDWTRVPLGCTTDTEIARWLGLSERPTVAHARLDRGIPVYSRVLWDKVPLGEVPDTVIAVWVGLTVTALAKRRSRLLIPAAPRTARRDRGGRYKMELRQEFLAPRELRFPVS